jgi:hypothetical protein
MIRVKIKKQKVLELGRSEYSTTYGNAGQPDAGEMPLQARAGMEESATLEDGTLVCEACLQEYLDNSELLEEAEYHGRKVTLNKPQRGGSKKFFVYVKDPKTGNVRKVSFGDPNMKIKKSNPKRRKSFRARHKCNQKKDKTTPGYWSCHYSW